MTELDLLHTEAQRRGLSVGLEHRPDDILALALREKTPDRWCDRDLIVRLSIEGQVTLPVAARWTLRFLAKNRQNP